ncbi:Rossmann-like domain-containing protein [Actinomyces ruminis]|uniref:Heavy-metal chelation n=1 Tax=Actinomyces ruminis TaxID=1937003 RepID=A0ABX4MCJ6_9ACTO|nr:DUF364 domain-containing protein [Actinomyces ruminis]PHP53215.1 hypothetical protein BW737_004380 [Actinomyces ruminis]
MVSPWEVYEALIDDLPDGVAVVASDRGPRWTRVLNSVDGLGSAWSLTATTRPAACADISDAGRPLRDVAALVKSWNLAEASVGLAAINSWYSRSEVAASHGFVPTGDGLTWAQVFDPYRDAVADKTVAIIGHFPFAGRALGRAGEVWTLERDPRPGDYPDSACEYLLPQADYVFISSSSLVNKTMPRLIDLAVGGGAHTVLVGPSTPMHPLFLDLGVATVTGFVPALSVRSGVDLEKLGASGEIGPGTRMHLHAVGQ